MTGKQKLRKLADFLERKVKDSWFSLEVWGNDGFVERKCGTTACAAGWATVCFPRSGLSLRNSEICYKRKRRRKLVNMDAVQSFFDLDRKTASFVFLPLSYSESRGGRRSVARRLRQVANNEIEIPDD